MESRAVGRARWKAVAAHTGAPEAGFKDLADIHGKRAPILITREERETVLSWGLEPLGDDAEGPVYVISLPVRRKGVLRGLHRGDRVKMSPLAIDEYGLQSGGGEGTIKSSSSPWRVAWDTGADGSFVDAELMRMEEVPEPGDRVSKIDSPEIGTVAVVNHVSCRVKWDNRPEEAGINPDDLVVVGKMPEPGIQVIMSDLGRSLYPGQDKGGHGVVTSVGGDQPPIVVAWVGGSTNAYGAEHLAIIPGQKSAFLVGARVILREDSAHHGRRGQGGGGEGEITQLIADQIKVGWDNADNNLYYAHDLDLV